MVENHRSVLITYIHFNKSTGEGRKAISPLIFYMIFPLK